MNLSETLLAIISANYHQTECLAAHTMNIKVLQYKCTSFKDTQQYNLEIRDVLTCTNQKNAKEHLNQITGRPRLDHNLKTSLFTIV